MPAGWTGSPRPRAPGAAPRPPHALLTSCSCSAASAASSRSSCARGPRGAAGPGGGCTARAPHTRACCLARSPCSSCSPARAARSLAPTLRRSQPAGPGGPPGAHIPRSTCAAARSLPGLRAAPGGARGLRAASPRPRPAGRRGGVGPIGGRGGGVCTRPGVTAAAPGPAPSAEPHALGDPGRSLRGARKARGDPWRGPEGRRSRVGAGEGAKVDQTRRKVLFRLEAMFLR